MKGTLREHPVLATLVGVGVVVLGLSGCAPPLLFANAGVTLAEAGTSAFIEGELRSARKHPLELVASTYRQALERLDFPVIKTLVEPDYIYLAASQKNGDEIQVRMTRNSSTVTSIRIRVGLLGDQAIARLVMEEAQLILQAVPTAPSDDSGTGVTPSPR